MIALAFTEVRSAVFYEKSQSLVKCEYVWRRTDEWINFPWSVLPPVRKAGEPVTPSREALQERRGPASGRGRATSREGDDVPWRDTLSR